MSHVETRMGPIELAGFEMLEKIGQGGMAVVWKARQISLDRIVAIKFLLPQFSSNREDVQRLLTEARSAAKLKHPGIVQVYDANEVHGVYYIVMEYIAGYNVGEWLRRKHVIGEKDAVLVAECVARALQYAWTHAQIIHCDIKPDNVMVDRDGTIKVADLGLSRTIGLRSERGQTGVEEVMGTPSYISPEQSRGGIELDCRTDIYALGAMLYHMLTGRRLFEQYSDAEAMDKQISDFDADPLDINPQLSNGVCWLIEKMLAKDRDRRQPDWAAVIADIHAVQRGRLPVSPPAADGASTIQRNRRRVMHLTPAAAKESGESTTTGKKRHIGITLGITAFVVAAFATWILIDREPSSAPVVPAGTNPAAPIKEPIRAPVGSSAAVEPQRTATNPVQDAYEYAHAWMQAHPREYQEAIAKFQDIAGNPLNLKVALMAKEEIKRLRKEWEREVDESLKALEQRIQPLLAEHRYLEAAEVCEHYAGAWPRETEPRRIEMARQYRQEAMNFEETRRQETSTARQQFGTVLERIGASVITGNLTQAMEMTQQALSNRWATAFQTDLEAAHSLLSAAANIQRRIADSFRLQKGQEITVNLKKGPVSLVVVEVGEPCRVVYEPKLPANVEAGKVRLEFDADDLALAEKTARMGSDDQPDAALIRGLMAMQEKSYSRAADCFAKAGPPLADVLVAAARKAEQRVTDEKAEGALAAVMKLYTEKIGNFDSQAWLAIIQSGSLDYSKRQEAAKRLEKFRERYGSSDFARKAEAVLKALAKAAQEQETPVETKAEGEPGAEAQPAPDWNGGLSEEAQRTVKTLREKNPGLRENEIRVAERNGTLYRIEIISPAAKDLAPLAGLAALQELAVGAVPEEMGTDGTIAAPVWNLAPLGHLPLRKLYLGGTCVADLSPLRGANIKVLNLRSTQVRDITALQDLPLEELCLNNTAVKDVAALRGKTLRVLDVSNTRVYDLTPLSGASLRRLNVAHSQVREISCLRGMPLERLNLAGTRVSDFSVLKGLPLADLNLSDTQFKDFAVLKNLPLRNLNVRNVKIADLSLLAGLKLRVLDVAGTSVRDIDALQGMKLDSLILADTRVSNLTPLRDMPLAHLDLANTSVADLGPLQGMPLTYLDIQGTEVRDLTPLTQMPLTVLRLDLKRIRDVMPLRGLPIEELMIGRDIERLQDPGEWQRMRRLMEILPRLRLVNNRQVRW
jgi:serine/threonine-protein kinase